MREKRLIKVARDEDLKQQIGREIYFDLVDHDKVRNFLIPKETPFIVFKEVVAKEFGIPVQFQRFWLWAKRQNYTYRPNRPLTPEEEAQSVGQLREVLYEPCNAELKLFLEVELGPDLRPIAPPDQTKEDILLFFKLYDPENGELRYVGRLFVRSSGMPIDILAKLNEMAGFAPDEEIELYEEIKFEPFVMCEHIDRRTSFQLSQIEDGDIICFQKCPPIESEEDCRYPDVPSFLEYVHNRQVVHFRSLENPKEDDFLLELTKQHTYDDVVERVARQIGLDDPSKIRLTSHNCYNHQPYPQPIKFQGVEHLSDMLVHYNQTSDILYYEVLDIPLPELQGLKHLKVAFHLATKNEVLIHNIRIPKQSTMGDVINELKTKVELSNPNAELRLLQVFNHKIYKIFSSNEKIENIDWTLRAEEIPEEEKNLGPHDRLIHVYHFTRGTAQNKMPFFLENFGEPFFLVIHEGETLADIKVRIQKKLQVPAEEFAKWKYAFLSLGQPEYLQDSDIVFTLFQRIDVYADWEQYLGLEHYDHTPNKSYSVNPGVQDVAAAVADDDRPAAHARVHARSHSCPWANPYEYLPPNHIMVIGPDGQYRRVDLPTEVSTHARELPPTAEITYDWARDTVHLLNRYESLAMMGFSYWYSKRPFDLDDARVHARSRSHPRANPYEYLPPDHIMVLGPDGWYRRVDLPKEVSSRARELLPTAKITYDWARDAVRLLNRYESLAVMGFSYWYRERSFDLDDDRRGHQLTQDDRQRQRRMQDSDEAISSARSRRRI